MIDTTFPRRGIIMASVLQMYELASRHHRAGDLHQAEVLYRQILQLDPVHSASLYGLGLVASRAGRHDVAVDCLQQAIRLQPESANVFNDLGNALKAQGKFAEALASYRQALRLQPDFALAHYNLGCALHHQGKLDEAIASYRHVLRLQPDLAEAHCNLGYALKAQGNLDEAIAHYRQAIRLKPDYVEAYNNLGIALKAQGHLPAALDSYRQALAHKADYALAHYNLGGALFDAGEVGEAITRFQHAIRLQPDLAEAHNSLARAYAKLGNALTDQGKLAEGLANYEHAVRLKPDFGDAHYDLAFNRLLAGDFKRGWTAYEWRLRCKRECVFAWTQPAWDGSPLNGRTILLHAEQGLGDTLQFIRYAPLVRQRGGRVILACQPPLASLLRRFANIEQVCCIGEPLPAHDVYAPLMSLPLLLGHFSADQFPADVPYLKHDPELVERWRRRLESVAGLRVGIAWQGAHVNDPYKRRSIPLHHFALLAEIPGVRLISLQKGPGSEQLDQQPGLALDLGPDLDAAGAFTDTAAIMKNLDLVISSDTAIPHLAGALAVPAWLPLRDPPDWRWLLDREDSPWYPTLRLFRQRRPGDWDEVFGRIKASLLQAGEAKRRC